MTLHLITLSLDLRACSKISAFSVALTSNGANFWVMSDLRRPYIFKNLTLSVHNLEAESISAKHNLGSTRPLRRLVLQELLHLKVEASMAQRSLMTQYFGQLLHLPVFAEDEVL